MRGGLFHQVARLLYWGAAVSLLVIVLTMIGRVASRNFELGVTGLQLYAQLFAVWLTFLVAGSLAWERRHIEIDYFTKKIPQKYKPVHEMGVSVLNILSAVVILAGSALAIQSFWNSTSPSVNIPIPLYYAAPLIGFGFLVVIWSYRIYFDTRVLFGLSSPDEITTHSTIDARGGQSSTDGEEQEGSTSELSIGARNDPPDGGSELAPETDPKIEESDDEPAQREGQE